MRKALKILRKIFFWIFFVGLFLTTVVTVILYVYEDEIKQFAIDELNQRLKTEVQVEDIELSIFHAFPSASIEFKKVFIADAYPEIESDDTLFHAESMFFNFNIMDIYSGNYKVNRISLLDGGLHLKTSEDGQTNFDILKDNDEENEEDDKFDFLLELLKVENFDLKYKNLASQQYYELLIHDGLFQGNFSANEYSLISECQLKINRLKSNSFTLVKNKEAQLNMELAVDAIAESYTFNKGDLKIEEMPFHITGVIDSASLDLQLSGNNIELDDLANSLVDESMENVKSYQGEGVINFVSHVHGPLSPTEMPAIEANFDINGGSINEPESDLTITDVSFIGQYLNEQKERPEQLILQNVKMNLLNSHFLGEATITDFAEPILKTSMDGNINLARFHQFFIFENVEKLAGKVNFHLNAVVQFFDPEFSKERFDVLKSDGTFQLDKVQYKSVHDDMFYKEVSGQLVLNDKDAAANQLMIRTENSDLLINGAMKNLMPFIDGSGNLGMIASIESENLDLNEFLDESNKKSAGPLKIFELPDNLNLNVDLDLAHLKWDNHHFEMINGKMLMSNRVVKMNALNFNMLQGSVRGNLVFKNLLEQGNIIDGRLFYNGININTLFEEWDNFNQNSITSKHLSGKASGSIDLLLCFNPYFSLIDDKLFSKCDLKIENGELNDLETMKAVTDYMRSNKGLKLLLNNHIDQFEEKLLHIKFSSIENQITIKDRKIVIPKMLIKTSALDIELFGWHDFDNQIEYHFSFRFRELKTQATDNEFGIIEDDGLGLVIYLTMFGDLDDPDFALDGAERRKEFKQNLADEKQDIKSMLKSELGFFKNDTTVQLIEKNNRNEIQFIIYNGEQENGKDTIVTEDKKNKKHTLKLFEKWKGEADQKKGKIEYEEDD